MTKQAKSTNVRTTAAKKKIVKKAAPKPKAKIAEIPVWAKETRYTAKFLR